MAVISLTSCLLYFLVIHLYFSSSISASPTGSVSTTDGTDLVEIKPSLTSETRESIKGPNKVGSYVPLGGIRWVSDPTDPSRSNNVPVELQALNEVWCDFTKHPKQAAACIFCECTFGVMWGCVKTSAFDKARFERTHGYQWEDRNNPVLQTMMTERQITNPGAPEEWCIKYADCICTDSADLSKTVGIYLEERLKSDLDLPPVYSYPETHYALGKTGPGVSDPMQEFPYHKMSSVKKRDFTGAKPFKDDKDICLRNIVS